MVATLTAVLVALPTFAVALVAIWRLFVVETKVWDIHLSVNSRLDQLLAAVEARGVAAGRKEILDEQSTAGGAA